jgi:hypothetical protein
MPTIQDLISILTFDNFDVGAVEPMAACLTEGYAYAADSEVSVQRYVTENWESIQRTEGLLDAWIGTLILITYAQGIAVGQGRKELLESDVLLAREQLCDRFPKCYLMRIESAISALDHLAGNQLSGPHVSGATA